jgi:hypothetical protein
MPVFLMAPTRPASPEPNNNAAAGKGTGAFTTLPLKMDVLVKA